MATPIRNIRVSDEVWRQWGDAAAARLESIAERVHRAMTALAKVEALSSGDDLRLVGADAQAEDLEGPRSTAEIDRYVTRIEVEPDPPQANPAVAEFDNRAHALPKRRLKRTSMCEHRVPATSYCSRCDA